MLATIDPARLADMSVAQIADAMRAGRIAPLPPRKQVQFKLTANEREAMIADMQDWHRPNGKAAMGGTR